MKRSLEMELDTKPITLLTKNGSSERWKLKKGIKVVLILDGLYNTRQRMIDKVVSNKP